MKAIIYSAIFSVIGTFALAVTFAQDARPKAQTGSNALTSTTKPLSEISKLKAENFKLRLQLIQTQIAQEQAKLTSEFVKELSCATDFDWQSLLCKE
jgi:hypothetical protein